MRVSPLAPIAVLCALLACKKSGEAPPAPASVAPSAVAPSAAEPVVAAGEDDQPSYKCEKKLAFGKTACEATKEELGKALEDDGWKVGSTAKSSSGKHETLSASGSKGDLSVFATIPKLGAADFRDWRFGQLRKATDSASWLDVDAAVVVEVKKNSVYDAEASKALLGKLTGQ